MVISIATAAGFFAGLLLGKVKWLFKTYFVAFQLLLMGSGFFIIAISNHLVLIGLGVGLMGFGSILPTVFGQVSRQVPQSQTVQAMAIVTSVLFFGQFSSPLLLDGIGALSGNESIRFMYMFLSSGMILVAFSFLGIAYKVGLTDKKKLAIE